MKNKTCRNCKFYKQNPLCNEDEGNCTNTVKQINQTLYWRDNEVVVVSPFIFADSMWCDLFEEIKN